MVIGRGPLPPGDQGGQVVTEKGQVAPESAARPLAEDLPVAPDLGRRHGFPRRRRLYPERFLLPRHRRTPVSHMEPDPAIVPEARRSNVHVLWVTDKLMDRLAEITARKACYPPNSDDIRRGVAAVTDGQIRYTEPRKSGTSVT